MAAGTVRAGLEGLEEGGGEAGGVGWSMPEMVTAGEGPHQMGWPDPYGASAPTVSAALIQASPSAGPSGLVEGKSHCPAATVGEKPSGWVDPASACSRGIVRVPRLRSPSPVATVTHKQIGAPFSNCHILGLI